MDRPEDRCRQLHSERIRRAGSLRPLFRYPIRSSELPIDVRTEDEWLAEHIVTPAPEDPRHHPLADLQDPIKLRDFMDLIYCDWEGNVVGRMGDRSPSAVETDFRNLARDHSRNAATANREDEKDYSASGQ